MLDLRPSKSDIVPEAKKFLQHKTAIIGKFEKIAQSDGFGSALNYINETIRENPYHRQVLVKLYAFFKNTAGRSGIADALSLLFIEINESQSQLSQSIWNSPFICEEPNLILNRIGEGCDQSALVIQMLSSQILKEKPVLLVSKSTKHANIAMLDYYRDAFEIITDEKEFNELLPLRSHSFFNSYIAKFSDDIFGHNGELTAGIHTKFQTLGKNPFVFNLKEETEEVALKYLKNFGLSHNEEFVTIHVRESGYVDAEHHNIRNYNPDILDPAIDYLLQSGLKVVRIGHNKMSRLSPRPGLIDLAHEQRPGEVDIFLCAVAKFFIGTPSGPWSLAYQFGTPTLQIGHYTQCQWRLNGLVHIQPIREIETGRTLSMKELKLLDLHKIVATKPYEMRGLSPVPLSERELLKATQEMIDFKDNFQLQLLNESFEADKSELGIANELMFTSDSVQHL